MGTELQMFRFNGDNLAVSRQGDVVFVGIKRVCDALGVAHQSQLEKLKDKPWATVTTSVTVAEDGKQREMAMLHLDSLPMWLATIDVKRVSAEARPKLIEYQKHCARVLRDYFFGGGQAAPQALDREVVKAIVAETLKVSKASKSSKASAKQTTRPTVKALVESWVDNHVEVSIDPSTVMVDVGIAASSNEADLMPVVRKRVSTLLLSYGVEVVRRSSRAIPSLGPDDFAAAYTSGCPSGLKETARRNDLWSRWCAWADDRHLSHGTRTALFAAMRRAGWTDVKREGNRSMMAPRRG